MNDLHVKSFLSLLMTRILLHESCPTKLLFLFREILLPLLYFSFKSRIFDVQKFEGPPAGQISVLQ